ncbi:MAG: hypothetical protein R2827_10005 [Bdellovibrionales bacterium]
MLKRLVIMTICGLLAQATLAATEETQVDAKSKTAAELAKSATPSPYTFGWTTENYVFGSDLDAGNAAKTVSDNYLTVDYKLNDSTKLFLWQMFHFDYDKNESLEIGDIVVGYSARHGMIPGGWNVSSSMRLYMPVREYNQKIGKVQYRFYGKVDKDISKNWNIAFETNPRIYGYTRYQDGQLGLNFRNHVILGYKASDRLYVNTYLGHAHYNSYTGKRYDEEKAPVEWDDPFDYDDAAYLDLEFVSPLNDNITLIGVISQETDLRNPEPTYYLKPSETLYFIIGVISI